MTALHARIRADIEARIRSGQLRPGDRIPNETELMQTWGCARMTVNRALSALAADGRIERRRKAGSFVAAPDITAMVLDIPDLEAQARSRGESYAFQLLSRNVVEGRMILTGLHVCGGRPLCHEDRVIDLSTVPEASRADFSAMSPGAWLLHSVPWTRAENRISAVTPGRDVARLMDLAPHAACLLVERDTWRDEAPVTRVRQLFDGAHYHLVARFTP